jgi:hypothetical protein
MSKYRFLEIGSVTALHGCLESISRKLQPVGLESPLSRSRLALSVQVHPTSLTARRERYASSFP